MITLATLTILALIGSIAYSGNADERFLIAILAIFTISAA